MKVWSKISNWACRVALWILMLLLMMLKQNSRQRRRRRSELFQRRRRSELFQRRTRFGTEAEAENKRRDIWKDAERTRKRKGDQWKKRDSERGRRKEKKKKQLVTPKKKKEKRQEKQEIWEREWQQNRGTWSNKNSNKVRFLFLKIRKAWSRSVMTKFKRLLPPKIGEAWSRRAMTKFKRDQPNPRSIRLPLFGLQAS